MKKCPDCGMRYERTTTHGMAVCPHGHGKLVSAKEVGALDRRGRKRVPGGWRDRREARAAWVATLPLAYDRAWDGLRIVWSIGETGARYHRVRLVSGPVELDDGQAIARVGNGAVLFRPVPP